MKKLQRFRLLFYFALLFPVPILAQTVIISGPSEVCPSLGSTPTYTYTANSSVAGCFGWFVLQDGVWQNLTLSSCPCGNTSKSSSVNIAFNSNEGEAKVRVVFHAWYNIACLGASAIVDKMVQKRTFGPGTPFDADGGLLTICPGETKTFFIPGGPGEISSEENCFWHHSWIWTAPPGWQINGGTNEFAGDKSVSVTAPSNAVIGQTYPLKVETDSLWPWYKDVVRQIHVSYSENVVTNGPAFVCTSNTAFNVQNLPANTSVSWTQSSNMSYVSGQNTNNYVVKAQSSSTSGSGWLQSSLSGTCGSSVLPQKAVWVGRPASSSSINGPTSPSTGNTVAYFLSNSTIAGSTSFDWTLPYCYGCSIPWTFASGTNSSQILANVGTPDGYVQARGQNVCGFGGASILYVNPSGGGGGGIQMMFYPNPADDEVTVQVDNYDESKDIDIVIIDGQQRPIVQNRGKSGKPSVINTRGMRKGTYFLKVTAGEKTWTEQLIIER